MMSESKSTTEHRKIREWAEARGGKPAQVKGTSNSGAGIIRIMFPNVKESERENLEEITWDAFFEKFDQNELCLVYQEETHGQKSNFHKLVSRERS